MTAWQEIKSLSDLPRALREAKEFPHDSPLNDPARLSWLADRDAIDRPEFGPVVLVGEGPFPRTAFAEAFADVGLSYRYAETLAEEHIELINPGAVVLGETGCSERTLLSLISQEDAGKPGAKADTLRCHLEDGALVFKRSVPSYIPFLFSQQFMIYRLLLGRNPFKRGSAFYLPHVLSHPALRFLDSHRGFKWVALGMTHAQRNRNRPRRLREKGMLAAFGYHVGKSGLAEDSRRTALTDLYCAEVLPAVESESYLAEWGLPSSSRRLQKMAQQLALFWSFAQNRESSPEEAMTDWETDLDWLKSEFYDGTYDNVFAWPTKEL